MGASRRQRTVRASSATGAVLAIALAGAAGGSIAGAAQAAPPAAEGDARAGTVMMPTGGGYEEVTLQAFGRSAATRGGDATVDIVVVPSAYGDAPEDREENIDLARERTQQIEDACTAVAPAGKRCLGRLAILLNRADALNASRSAALRSATLDGIYVLGGDQGLAVEVLANSPAERAMTTAVNKGVVLGGTSAGAAVESRTMINGYRGDFGPAQGLRKGATLIWWGNDADPQRGLAFGSRNTIYDQHFYQRGRFGRSLTTLAIADERLGTSPVGVGADYGTGLTNTGDRTLSGVYGLSSVATIDYETLNATHKWSGTQQWLGAHNIVTNLLTERTSYDLRTRVLTRNGNPQPAPSARLLVAPDSSAASTLFVGGGMLGGRKVLSTVISEAAAGNSVGKDLYIVSLDGAATANRYAAKIDRTSWRGDIHTVVYGTAAWRALDLDDADGLIVASVSPPSTARAMANAGFRATMTRAASTVPVVFADGPAGAIFGARWSPETRPDGDDYEDRAIAAFRAGDAAWQPGLGIIDATIVPALNTDYQWGRLYEALHADPADLALGVSAGAALRFGGGGAGVVDGPTVVADARQGSLWTSRNGSLGAANVILDVFAPGERF